MFAASQQLTDLSLAAGHRLEKGQSWSGFSLPLGFLPLGGGSRRGQRTRSGRQQAAGSRAGAGQPRGLAGLPPCLWAPRGAAFHTRLSPVQQGAPSLRLAALSTAKSHWWLAGRAGQRVGVFLDDPMKEGGRFCVTSGRPGDVGQTCLEQMSTSTPPAGGVRRLGSGHFWGPGLSPTAPWWLSWTRPPVRGPRLSCQHL